MRSYQRAAVAAIVIGFGIIGQGIGPAMRAAYAAYPSRDRIFAGLQGGTVYASGDAGGSWQETDAGLPTGTDIASLAVAPGGHTIYAGTAGAGVYASSDEGRSWQDDNAGDPILSGGQIRSVLVSPTNGQLVYVATRDGYLGRSYDAGKHWQARQLPIGSLLTTLAIDGGRPSTLLAGTSGDGLLLSTDAGASWSTPFQNIPASTSVNAFAASPTNAGVIYAGTDNGIYQTIDGGATWQRESRGIPDGITIDVVAVDPQHGTRVVAGDANGNIYRSLDGGTTWNSVYSSSSAQINALLYDPARPGTILAGTTGSTLYRSTDQGANWYSVDSSSFSSAPVLCLAISVRAISPTDPVNPPAGGLRGVHYFVQTGHTVRGTFYAFYQRYGDLKVFGLPLTEAYSDHGQVVQYFERARLALTASGVRESPLGSLLTAGRAFPITPPFRPTATRLFFSSPPHSLSGHYLQFWLRHHGQLLFGAPISEPLPEQNGDGTGRTYQVQYFQNARLEYHPELAGTDNEVQLGLLGRQYLRKIGLL